MTPGGWNIFPQDLLLGISQHCMFLVDDSNVLVAGGSTEKQFFTSKTFFFNFDSNLWRNGPDLKVPRGKHACGMVQKDGNTSEVQTYFPKPGSIAEKNRTRLQISMQQDFVSLKYLYCEICSSKFWTNVMFKRLVLPVQHSKIAK